MSGFDVVHVDVNKRWRERASSLRTLEALTCLAEHDQAVSTNKKLRVHTSSPANSCPALLEAERLR
jgi:hypothetical protein